MRTTEEVTKTPANFVRNIDCATSDLNPRDDLESLAYVLLYLLRGSLPWHKLSNSGTAVGRIVQIREKMKTWTGSKLASGYPAIFGKLLDDARRLEFDEPIDYDGYRHHFQQILASSTSISHTLFPICMC